MGWGRKLIFVLGLALIVLPILPYFSTLNLIPQEPNIGFVGNDILSFVVGAVLLILVFLSWRGSVRRRQSWQAQQRHMSDSERLRMGYAGQFNAIR